MQQRTLGQGLTVSAMGLGTMGMTSYYGAAEEHDAIRVIHRALELGVNFLDTAEAYGPFTNEVLVGKAIKGRRDAVILASKFAWDFPADGSERRLNGRPEHVIEACEGSLKRLGIEYIDLYYQHRLDPNVPIEETMGALAQLVKQGKIRHIGLSEMGPKTIQRALTVHPVTAIQTEYSLWERGPESAILPFLRTKGIGFVAYSPLGRGFLTGQIKSMQDLPSSDFRHTDPRFQGENFTRNLSVVERVQELAHTKKATPGQIALAWTLHKGNDIVPIPGTKRMQYLEENIAAAAIDLSAADIAHLDDVTGQAQGERYHAAMMRVIANAE
ncbi:MAG TPA: aldo/keto reductase [Ktedonobacteraceae bacterium]|jgi:aryl-alcohol dehydrogenase-like predicted oxidoreductase|nr:aldo/keto reductase [Ktedonobacteraceae bacterium]